MLIRVLGVVFALAGAWAWLSIFVTLWHLWRYRKGVHTSGVVVEHLSESFALPVIGFQDHLGNQHSFSPEGTSFWERAYGVLPVGSRVYVVYLPEDPEKVRLLVDTAELNADRSLKYRAEVFFFLAIWKTPIPGISAKSLESRLRRKLRKRGMRTVATVIDERRTYGIIHPKIQFTTEHGEGVTFTHKFTHAFAGGSSEQIGLPAVGEHVEVVHLQGAPHTARLVEKRLIVDIMARLVWGAVLVGVGTLFVLVELEYQGA